MCREGQALTYLSVYSDYFCRVLKYWLIHIHLVYPLLFSGCFRNPLFRETDSIADEVPRTLHCSEYEEFTRNVVQEARA